MRKYIIAFLLIFCFVGLIRAEEETRVYTYTTPGTYTATVTATDSYGAQTTATIEITVGENQPPVVNLTADKTSGIAPLTINFTATASDPEGEPIVEYTWDFGDGNTDISQNNESKTHTYAKAGKYFPTLTVKNNISQEASDTVSITAKKSIGGCLR